MMTHRVGPRAAWVADSPSVVLATAVTVPSGRSQDAADDSAESRVMDRTADFRPDNAAIRFRIPAQTARAGSPAEAVVHYKAAIAKLPALLLNS